MQEFYRVKAENWFNFFSMERSGHVAVLNWLMHQCPKPCARVTPPHVPTGTPGAGYYYPGAPLIEGKSASNTPPVGPIRIAGINFRDSGLFAPEGYPRANKSVILLRDIRNLLASRATHSRNWDLKETVQTWIKYANAFYAGSDTIPYPCVPIYFNQWFSDKQYRQTIVYDLNKELNLNLTFTDKGLNEMQPAGGGSSFDQLYYNGHAQDMNVLNRYLHINVTKFVTKEAREMDELLFGPWGER